MIVFAAAVIGGLAYAATTSDSGDGGTPPDNAAPQETASATTEVRNPIEETEEFIRSTEACPPELPGLDAVPVMFGIALEPFIEMVDATVITFIDTERGFVGDRAGRVWAFDQSGRLGDPVINLSANTSVDHDQGLLGLTLDPAQEWLYLHHTDGADSSVVRAYPHDDGEIDSGGMVEIMVVDQPSPQHNGGDLAFGPEDGYLYLSLGDGGGLGDPFHNGQDATTVLGAILRLDVDPLATPPFGPAAGNPYRNDPDKHDLIWAHGLRNAFRISFDRVQGDLWIADVGQQCIEEITILGQREAGTNLGWNRYEGTRRFLGDPLRDHKEPAYEYGHGRGLCAVVGGYVYRGQQFPQLLGRYVFTDLCNGTLFAFTPGGTPEVIELPLATSRPVGFGQDSVGELYVVDIESGVHRLIASDLG